MKQIFTFTDYNCATIGMLSSDGVMMLLVRLNMEILYRLRRQENRAIDADGGQPLKRASRWIDRHYATLFQKMNLLTNVWGAYNNPILAQTA